MTLGDLAIHLAATQDHENRWRLVLEFLEEFSHEEPPSGMAPGGRTRSNLLVDQPSSCGDPRWDSLLAALAEHLSWADGTIAPKWCTNPELMWFGKVWFVDPLPSAQAWALAYSPAAFRRRGIFLHPDDLIRA